MWDPSSETQSSTCRSTTAASEEHTMHPIVGTFPEAEVAGLHERMTTKNL